jgi:TonB-dependent receptor
MNFGLALRPRCSWSLRRRARELLIAIGLVPVAVAAQTAATGTIEGRVLSKVSDAFLSNVRVSIEGTNREATTDENGAYRLSGVPAGESRLRAAYVGLEPGVQSVRIVAGQVVRVDFELARLGMAAEASSSSPITLAAVTVVEDREMSAQTLALNEQRAAPNIKNVVAFDEYPNNGDPNIAEFLKYIPGVAITYSGFAGNDASVRGIPGSDTPITIDGAGMAASSLGPGRNSSLFTVPINNISRIEVTKVPTPDMPANGLGGSINIISKGGFERKRPLFTYSLFTSFRSDDPLTLSKRAGPTPKLTTRHILPSVDLTYSRPINDSIAISLSATENLNYIEAHTTQPAWDLIRLVQTSSSWQVSPQLVAVRSGRVGVDWKMGSATTFGASIQYRKREAASAGHSFGTTYGAGATGGPTFVQGAATGVGSLSQSVGTWLELHNGVMVSNLKFSHQRHEWQLDGHAGYSVSKHRRPSTEKGYFSNISGSISNLVIRAEGISGSGNNKESIVPATYRIVDRTGAPVNPFDGNAYSITTAADNLPRSKETRVEGKLNAARKFAGPLPFSLKSGFAVARQDVSASDNTKSYTFRPGQPVDVRKAGNYGLVDERFSAQSPPYLSGDRIQWISARKAYELYQAQPDYFVLNEAAAHTTRVNGSRKFQETISGTYLRGDLKLLNSRLWLVTGVRHEWTKNEGWGALDDISAQYVKDPRGNLVRNAAGQPTLISTDALVRSQLRYKERGSYGAGDYQTLHPSFNGTYSITDSLVARLGYARTIGRPSLGLIIPGVAVSEPTATNPTITVVNSGLKPWTAHNYDLSLESYLLKGGFGSVGVFRKDIRGFFVTTASSATPELLETYGIPATGDYLNYTVATRGNGGDASITGMEYAYKQSLTFLPAWARGVQVFANLTKLSLGGSSQSDFTGFNPKTLSWGVSLVRSRFAIRFTASEQGETRRAPVAASATVPADTYLWQGAKTRYNIGLEYALSRRIGVHVSLNSFNGLGVTDVQRRYAPDTPEYARYQRFQEWGKNAVVGIKGEF